MTPRHAGAARLGRRDLWLLGFVLALLPPLRALLLEAGGFDLHFEEAQYWDWSRRLDWSYYSKGPLVAWLIAAADALPGRGEWQVRLLGWLAYDAFLLLLFLFARDLWASVRAGWWALALGLATPVYFTLGGVMTTDVLLFACWVGGLWAAWRALAAEDPRGWYAFGAAVGIGALAKLSIGLLPVAVGLVLLGRAPWRRQLATPHPWLAALLALAVMTPLIAWNAGHGWVMLRHNEGHITARGDSSGHLGELLAGQVLALSPLLALWLAAGLWRPPRDAGARLLWLTALGVLAFFVLKAATGKVQPNWPAPAYIGLLVLLAGQAARGEAPWRWLPGAALATGGLLSLLVLFPGAVGVPGDRHPFRELQGWEEAVAEVARRNPEADFVLARHYGTAATLAYYWPAPRGAPGIAAYLGPDPGRRRNQYDLWPGPGSRAGEDAVYVALKPSLPDAVPEAFAGGCRRRPPVTARAADGRALRILHSWLCRGMGPVRWTPADRY